MIVLKINLLYADSRENFCFIFMPTQADQMTPRDLYERLELLESKILDLESFSPEYFNTAVCVFISFLLRGSARIVL